MFTTVFPLLSLSLSPRPVAVDDRPASTEPVMRSSFCLFCFWFLIIRALDLPLCPSPSSHAPPPHLVSRPEGRGLSLGGRSYVVLMMRHPPSVLPSYLCVMFAGHRGRWRSLRLLKVACRFF
ncbi:unnamed protein product [Lota lota]